MKLRFRSQTLLNFWGLLPVGRAVTIEVPCCSRCAGWLRAVHTLEYMSSYLVGALAAGLMYRFVPPQIRHNRLFALGIIVALVAPYAAVKMFFPPCFSVTVSSQRLEYEFKDPDYAAVFRALNQIV